MGEHDNLFVYEVSFLHFHLWAVSSICLLLGEKLPNVGDVLILVNQDDYAPKPYLILFFIEFRMSSHGHVDSTSSMAS